MFITPVAAAPSWRIYLPVPSPLSQPCCTADTGTADMHITAAIAAAISLNFFISVSFLYD